MIMFNVISTYIRRVVQLLILYIIHTISFTKEQGNNIVLNTVNRERFSELNFQVFPGFQECRKSFSANIYTSFV